MAAKSRKRWSQRVTRESNALDLDEGVFAQSDPRAMARSLKRSAERSRRRKADPYRSAMSMLTFYINRAGKQLSQKQRKTLENAKDELRDLYGRPSGVRRPRRRSGMTAIARIEDFEPGQHVVLSKTFTDDDVQRFIDITGDTNPLHVDEEFASRTQFGGRVLHGMLTASLFSTMVGMLLPGTGAIYRSQTIKFLLPVRVGETVTAHFVVRSVDRAKHRLTIDSWIENEAGERVIEGVCEAGLIRDVVR